jgi:hypothetical protein
MRSHQKAALYLAIAERDPEVAAHYIPVPENLCVAARFRHEIKR